jgi:hypothetical protein
MENKNQNTFVVLIISLWHLLTLKFEFTIKKSYLRRQLLLK